jgi:voltage-gated potassium channel Kch
MARKPSLKQRLQYMTDNLMSKGPGAMIVFLAVMSLVIVLIVAAVVRFSGWSPTVTDLVTGQERQATFGEIAWMGMMRTLDAGTMGGDQGSWSFLFSMFAVTLGGVFVVSSLIGILSSGLEQKLEQLQKGRSQVLEQGHTLILGWSPQVFTILSELMTANENQKNGRVVILAEKDKVEMEDEIRARVQFVGSTRVICRSGNPIDLTDLEIASPHDAKSVIILPPEVDDPDSAVIKTVLAITNNPNRREGKYHIVTQIRDPRNMGVIRMVGMKDDVQAVLTGDLIARMVAQTSRQSGLSVVYTELMNFGGDEIYFQEEPTLVGKTYREAQLAYEDSAVMGIQKADGTTSMNPPAATQIGPGDRIFAISADDDTVVVHGQASVPIDQAAIRPATGQRQLASEKTIILGWNRCGETIIRELDSYVAPGSRVTVLVDPDASEEAAGARARINECCGRMANQEVVFQEGDTTERQVLEGVKAADYDHVIVLSYAGLGIQEADAKTLVTLLHLRDIAEKDQTPFSIISEMLDLRNRELAEVAHVDDFIVSDHLISLMMSQLSENADLEPVFQDMFDPEGSEIYLKPAGQYVDTGKPVNFYTVTEAAARRNQTAIGYRLAREAIQAPNYGVHTNPKKSEPVTFAPEDKIIVLAED